MRRRPCCPCCVWRPGEWDRQHAPGKFLHSFTWRLSSTACLHVAEAAQRRYIHVSPSCCSGNRRDNSHGRRRLGMRRCQLPPPLRHGRLAIAVAPHCRWSKDRAAEGGREWTIQAKQQQCPHVATAANWRRRRQQPQGPCSTDLPSRQPPGALGLPPAACPAPRGRACRPPAPPAGSCTQKEYPAGAAVSQDEHARPLLETEQHAATAPAPCSSRCAPT